jgi:N-acetylglucosaminyldiphosphoundecaprenol N-acetyl-beta-D-mannosaminyltransferase
LGKIAMNSENDQNMLRTLVILGIPFHDVTFAQAVDWSVQRMRSGRPGYIATANVDFVMQSRRDPELQRILLEADLVVADGSPLIRLSGLFGPKLRERVTGSDLTPLLAGACRDQGLSIFALGAAPGVAGKAMDELQKRYPGLKVAGYYSPPMADILNMQHEEILERVKKAGPDLLLAAFGAPKQEKWINMHFRSWKVPLAIGIGGTLDFIAGVQRRAPLMVQKAGMEWLWRMLTSPRRLFGRYASNLLFLAREAAWLWMLSRPQKRKQPVKPLPDRKLLNNGQAQALTFKSLTSDEDLKAFMDRALPVGEKSSLVLDLARAVRLSSLELGVLVSLNKACRAAGHRLFLWNAGARICQYLQASGLTRYLDIVESTNDLLARLNRLSSAKDQDALLNADQETLLIRLPLELTVSGLDDFQKELDRQWSQMTASGSLKQIIIDARALEFIDSAALGFLVGLKKKADMLDIDFACRGFRGPARQTIRLAQLEALLNVTD